MKLTVTVTSRRHASTIRSGDVVEGRRAGNPIPVRVDRVEMNGDGWTVSGTAVDSPGGRRVRVLADDDGSVEVYPPAGDLPPLRAAIAEAVVALCDRPVAVVIDGETMAAPDMDIHPDVLALNGRRHVRVAPVEAEEPAEVDDEPEPVHG